MANFYAVVPMWILGSNELTPLDKLLCSIISGLSEQSGYCYASNEKLGEFLGISDGAAKKALSRLTSKEIVKNIGNKFDRKLILTFIENSQDTKGQIIPLDDTKGQNDTSKGQNIPFSSIIYTNNNIDGATELHDRDFFEQFWKIYPRKSNKSAAKQKFNRLNAKKQQNIITLTYYFADAMKDRTEEFIPMATTYLNQERYLDYEQEHLKDKSEILQPKEGAENEDNNGSALEALADKVLKLVKMYRGAKSDSEAQAMNERGYESFKLSKEGAAEQMFSDAELEVLTEVGADIKGFCEFEWQDGEIKRLLKGYVC